MAEEYAGKKRAPEPLNYSNLVSLAIDPLVAAHEKRKTAKAELDSMYQNADAGDQETEQFQNQTLNTLVTDGADLMRNNMYMWNQELKSGRLKPNEYKARFNNAQQNWAMFANQAKSYDDTMANFLDRQQPNKDGAIPGSGFEQYMSGVFAGNADLRNTTLQVGDDGKVFLTKYDNEGNTTSSVDVSRMSNPGNMIDNRYDLSGSIQSEASLWADYKISTGSGWAGFTSIEDVRQNPAYQYAVDAKVQAVLSNNRSISSVLVDNGAGEYDYYQNADELERAIVRKVASAERVAKASGTPISESQLEEIAKATEKRMIKVEYDKTGVMQPLPTPDQVEEARKRVINEIEVQIGRDEVKKAGWKPSSSGGGSGSEDDGDSKALYPRLKRAWESNDAAALSALTGDDTYFEWTEGGLQAYRPKQVTSTDDAGEITYKNIGIKQGPPVKSIRDLSSVFYGESDSKGQGGAWTTMQKEIREYEARNKNKGKKQEETKQDEDPLGLF